MSTVMEQLTGQQESKETSANNNFSSLAPAAMFARRPAAITELTWAFYGGVLWANGAFRTLADDTVLLSGSATNYIYLDLEGDGTDPEVGSNTTGFLANHWPIAEIDTNASAITAERDRRQLVVPYPVRDHQAIDYAASVTPNALAGEVVKIATLTGAITINEPTNPYIGAKLLFLFEQDGTGSRVVTWNAIFNTPTDAGGAASETGGVLFCYDGSAWVQIGAALEWH